ncbi:TetR/AcrR family transcriptional regulator [Sphingobium lactosutens]|jgi:AcrR family transcriptional regulator|uniref:HTH tetR-type domain-containing protein n=1 Tax=Sphingobium lactosutens DS20 TaxID=1331060 RepID=T0IZ35_9SPHN|nr:TetR family transcriptional regulator [Sphingobium lactosutens]EQB17150.1 hypothetical protein RLDS_04150 [Sphingobium lactosutens DS20]
MKTTTKTRSTEAIRLDAAAWTDAALELLASNGIDGVRIELLAKRLEVTKGSFYWHFKDRDALHQAMLEQWRKSATLALIERLDRGEASPEARLQRLLRLPIMGQRSARAADVELAVRLWGRREPRAQAALEEIDQLRLHYISGLMMQCGADAPEAEARAILAYSYMRVAATLVATEARETMDRCEALLIGIRPPLEQAP